MFKWISLALAAIVVIGLGWVVNDLRLEIKRTSQTVNEHLPAILENVQKSTDTLASLSEDLKQLRDLAGASGKTRDKTLVTYADSLLDLLETTTDAQIGLEKKVLGGGLKSLMPVSEWVVDARKEALWLSFRASSKSELLTRLCENKFGSPWFIQFPGEEAVLLIEWLKANHPESQSPGENM
jgi:hypothetical protein